jgi:hypothetical protein
MKTAIMQPYFFPYLGYFQLIDAVDVYVNLDHVSFMPRSYMTRNVIKNDININIPVINGTQNKRCYEVKVGLTEQYITKFLKTLHHQYGKSINYEIVIEKIIKPCFITEEKTISQFNIELIKNICNLLDIKTKIIDSSCGFQNLELKREYGLVSIIHQLGSNTYINAIGGQKLYSKEFFHSQGIELHFLKMNSLDISNEYASILDLLFVHQQEKIKEQLKRYTLV